MNPRFHHVAVIGKYHGANAGSSRVILEEIAHFLAAQGCDVALERDTAQSSGIAHYGALDVDAIGAQCDLALVVGGDGTMLGFGRQLARYGVPLIGINQGRLGFMTDIPMANFRETIAPMIAGDYEEEHRTMLEGCVKRPSGDEFDVIYETFAVNDVVVSRGASAGMVELRVDVQDQFVANFRADGLIISSPTGSWCRSRRMRCPIAPSCCPTTARCASRSSPAEMPA